MESITAGAQRQALRYSTVSIALHWLIAALLVFEVALGLNMEAASGTAKFAVFQLHKSVGITILVLVLLRIVWRFYRRPPPIGASGWEYALAKLVHAAFYLLLLALPLSGWLIVSTSKIAVPTLLYGTIPWPHLPGFGSMAAAVKEMWNRASEFVHVNLVNLLYLLVALHVAGALKHHFIDRDGDFARMAPGVRTGSWRDPRLIAIGLIAIGAAAIGLRWAPERAAPVRQPTMTVTEKADRPQPQGVADPAEKPAEPLPAASDADEEAKVEAAEVAAWRISSGSSLRFRTNWSGEAIAGGFTKFDGDIVFSPDRLEDSRVTITVDTGSVFSGDSSRDATLKGSEWFAVESNRNAVFRADRFRRTGADTYVAQGSLRMKGVTAPLSIPFKLKITGDRAAMEGSATIDRLAYKIGEGEFSSTAEIPAAVAIDIVVKARSIGSAGR